MTVADDTAQQQCHHVVAVYDRDDELVSAIAAFLAAAVDEVGGVAVVVASPTHRSLLETELTASGHALETLAAAGRYRTLDAGDALASFMNNGRPDARAFAESMTEILAEAESGGGPVHVFGEMVALLWDEGNLGAAIELEGLWNDLAEDREFALFCAYAMSSLETAGDLATVKQMCDRHSGVIRLPERRHDASSRAADCDRCERMFVATPNALRDVRRFVREALADWGESDRTDAAEIIASELATNAVKHARSPFVVSIERTAPSIRIAVRDASFDAPKQLMRTDTRAGGRGVRLVASLSGAWGTQPESDGKTVWAEMSRR